MDRPDEERRDRDPNERPFAALDDDEAPASGDDAPVVTAAPLGAGVSGGPPGTLGTTGGAAETDDASAPKP
jgi:hypothetical protein